MIRFVVFLTTALLPAPFAAGQNVAPVSWLDRPLFNWNKPGAPLPTAPATSESSTAIIERCQLNPRQTTPSERAVAAAGWIPYLHFDRQLLQDDIEIIDGMVAADGMCRPVTFNAFVFVGGRFAGTLSPEAMVSRLDGSVGAIRIISSDVITAEFARYRATDPLCCPSSRVMVDYRVHRTGPSVVVTPTEVRTSRSSTGASGPDR
jgi:hypothetical protein